MASHPWEDKPGQLGGSGEEMGTGDILSKAAQPLSSLYYNMILLNSISLYYYLCIALCTITCFQCMCM